MENKEQGCGCIWLSFKHGEHFFCGMQKDNKNNLKRVLCPKCKNLVKTENNGK